MASDPRENQRSQELSVPPATTCPWCAYTGSFKQVLLHMESSHHARWRDLALYALISGGGPA